MFRSFRVSSAFLVLLTACGGPPTGADDAAEPEEAAAMKEVGQKAAGVIVWSSSRVGNHDLFTMQTDGSEVKQITRGEEVDWFPRFSPPRQLPS